MYVGFVARELLGQSAAVRITGTQGFDGKPWKETVRKI
jgi:hypothetical protein